MKTKHIFLFLMLVAALFTSCSNEMEEVQQGGKALLKIETEIEGSRAGIDATSFFEKDSIYLRFGGQSVEAVWNGNTWQHKDIELTEKPFDIFAFYYPYKDYEFDSWWMDFRHGSTSESWNVPLYNGNDVMVAKANDISVYNSTAKFRFQHIMARIRLEIDNGIEMELDSIKIEGIRFSANYSGYTGEITSATDYAEGEGFKSVYQVVDYAAKHTVDLLLIPTEGERKVTLSFYFDGSLIPREKTFTLPALTQGSYHVIPVNIKPYDEKMGIENGHTYVDLGLPSGVKWATRNVGSYTPLERGEYYAWGETTTKPYFQQANYKFFNGVNFTKYNRDDRQLLELEDDAAHVNWGGKWRIPTIEEWQELIDNCKWEWENWGVHNKGYRVYSNTNGKSIYIPAAGIMDITDSYVGSIGFYWTSTNSNSNMIRRFWFDEKKYECGNNMVQKYIGMNIRAVFK